jgi:hypothetical protein
LRSSEVIRAVAGLGFVEDLRGRAGGGAPEVDQKWALGEVGGGQVCDREAPQRGRGNVVRFGKIEIPGVDQHDAVFHRGPEAQPSSHPRRD